jgi:hypothetical protein
MQRRNSGTSTMYTTRPTWDPSYGTHKFCFSFIFYIVVHVTCSLRTPILSITPPIYYASKRTYNILYLLIGDSPRDTTLILEFRKFQP